jgi:hypothetical protein
LAERIVAKIATLRANRSCSATATRSKTPTRSWLPPDDGEKVATSRPGLNFRSYRKLVFDMRRDEELERIGSGLITKETEFRVLPSRNGIV